MTAKLITHEPNNDRTFEVSEAGLTIGRHTDNNASLDDSRLSRFHARITFRDGAWYAEDLGSTNGTTLNGERLEPNKPYPLKLGDHVVLAGKYDFKISSDAY